MSRSQTAKVGAGGLDALLRRLADGDRHAFTAVYDRVAPPLYRLATGRGLPAATSESFVEEVLLGVWRSAPRYPHQPLAAAEWVLGHADHALEVLEQSEERRTGRQKDVLVEDEGPARISAAAAPRRPGARSPRAPHRR